jgi:hypothetical protein
MVPATMVSGITVLHFGQANVPAGRTDPQPEQTASVRPASIIVGNQNRNAPSCSIEIHVHAGGVEGK